MTHFVPPYPERPSRRPPIHKIIHMVRNNFLGIFDEKCFEYQFFAQRILTRTVYVCNSPDTVAQAFIALHESFQRKTPLMRFALAPLVGDAVFII
jgi:hypothetical protein